MGREPNQRPQGRIDYDLWSYDVVDTAEGQHYRIIDLAGNYHGSYHNESAAQAAAWSNNRKVAIRQGRLYAGRLTGVEFLLMDDDVRIRKDVGTIVPGAMLMNAAGTRLAVSHDWFDELVRVNV